MRQWFWLHASAFPVGDQPMLSITSPFVPHTGLQKGLSWFNPNCPLSTTQPTHSYKNLLLSFSRQRVKENLLLCHTFSIPSACSIQSPQLLYWHSPMMLLVFTYSTYCSVKCFSISSKNSMFLGEHKNKKWGLQVTLKVKISLCQILKEVLLKLS